MASKKVEQTFTEITTYPLSTTSLLRMFNIMEEEDGTLFQNIFRCYTIYEDTLADSLYFQTYEIENSDWWEIISYKLYATVNLWWLVCMSNNILNPFEDIEAGKNLKILFATYIPQFIREMRNISDL